MASVNIKDLTKIYDKDVLAVDKANIEIQDKEFIVLVGPSGCGKSTTLRMVAGLEDITSGEIYIGDRLVNDVPPKDRDIAMVFQNYALYPHMTVYQNMAFGLKLRKYSKQEIDKRVNEAAEILEISKLLQRKPKALSGGQRQRVAVGRAIVRKPKVFLFDEPLSNLDAKLRVQMRTEISKLHSTLETTMIYVTHDQMEAMTMGDRIVLMKDGCIQQIDTPLSIYNTPNTKFVAGFIGSPAMNFLKGNIENSNGKLIFNEGKFKLLIPEKYKDKLANLNTNNVTLGIRPEDIYDADFAYGAQNPASIESIIEVVEPLGNEIFLYLKTEMNTFIARISAHTTPPVGHKIKILIDMNKVHFFETNTENII